jgi:mRNA interferase MazF
MRRGDVVVVAVNGDYGKARPAVIVQTDAFPESHASVVICQMTTILVEAVDFRISVGPSDSNGLHEMSQIMVDKPVTVKRERVGQVIGRLTVDQIVKLDNALAFVMGLAD